MHYLVLIFSLNLHYLYRYICILNVYIYVYGQLSAKDLLYKRIVMPPKCLPVTIPELSSFARISNLS